MKKPNHFFKTLLLTAAMSSASLSAQVTIGSDKEPEGFSVFELISNGGGGLRLPQMTTAQRDTLDGTTPSTGGSARMIAAASAFQREKADKALGLMFFNTDCNCVEVWNGVVWVQNCYDCSTVAFPAVPSAVTLCSGATIADLTTAAGSNVTAWYTATTGGSALANNTALTNGTTYYAEQTLNGCVNPTLTAVVVTVPSNPASITTYTNVMYDFQHQTLEAYGYGADATAFQWQYSTDNGVNWTDIVCTTNSTYTIPANVYTASAFGDAHSAEVQFQCLTDGTAQTANITMSILFIKTNTAGYAADANGVRYLTLQKGEGGVEGAGILKVALLNLGQSEGHNAADLGDFYQWGRVADGHEHTVWTKDATTHTNVFGTGTSNSVSYLANRPLFPTYDANRQVSSSDNTFYGKFIRNGMGNTEGGDNDWYNINNTINGHDIERWGNGNLDGNTRVSDIVLADWVFPQNNPCPTGWRVPSRWNVWDLYRGTGTDTPPAESNYNGTDNIWTFRAASNYATGGAIVTNANGEKLFLPAAGGRFRDTGSLSNVYYDGIYWTATSSSTAASAAFTMSFMLNRIRAGSTPTYKGEGYCVRCVQD